MIQIAGKPDVLKGGVWYRCQTGKSKARIQDITDACTSDSFVHP